MAAVLLNGTIKVVILGIENGGKAGSITLIAQKHTGKHVTGCHVAIFVGKTKFVCKKIEQPNNSSWEERLDFECCLKASKMVFVLHCDDNYANTGQLPIDVFAQAWVLAEDILKKGHIDRRVELVDENEKPLNASIHLWLQFSEARKWLGFPTSCFPQRIGCEVTLFQDAHTPDDFVQRKADAGLGKYESHGCWKDMFDKINEAKHFIYITAWSLDTKITLIRDPTMKPGSVPTLGELLEKKAKAGVRVVLLLWNDITAVRLFKNQGLMGTCDKETERYFKGTAVECVLRTHEKWMCSHHEKVVIVDSPLTNIAKRILVCYIGGLDLCKGRFDTPSHPLFSTLGPDGEHSRDFHQPNFKGTAITTVDDEYIIIGSANIIQRSMDGGRDTEIGMGAYQPYYLARGPNGATGQVHGFRMSLWLEHLGKHESTFLNPESKACIEKVNQLAEQNWKSYCDISSVDLHGHLLRYPYHISDDGTITELPGFEFFPDTKAKILGKDGIYMRLPFIRDLLLG